MLTSDKNIIRSGVCVRLDVTMWSARAKLRREDIPDADKLPPHELASLGSKKLFDTTRLRVFNTLKMRAWTLLDRAGARFMGGWLVDGSKLDDLNAQLVDIKREFDRAVSDFLVDYDAGVHEWLAQFPQWRSILEAAMPMQTELARKYSFNWQMYRIEGVNDGSSNMDAMAEGLADSALGEVRKMAMDIYRDTFKDTTRITKKSLRSLQPLCVKLDSVAFIHPQLQELSNLVGALVRDVNDDTDMSRNLLAVRALLMAMQQDDFFSAYVTPYDDGVKSSANIIDALAGTLQQPVVGAADVISDPVQFAPENGTEAAGMVTLVEPVPVPVVNVDDKLAALVSKAQEILSESVDQPNGFPGLNSNGLW